MRVIFSRGVIANGKERDMTTTWVQDIAFFGACAMAFSVGYGTGWRRGAIYAIERMLADIRTGKLQQRIEEVLQRYEAQPK